MANKIKYGLSNVYYAKLTEGATPTWGTPVAIPGAVSMTLDQKGEQTDFYADNMVYWTGVSNNGYEGSLEIALIPDSFKTDILGIVTEEATGLAYELANVQPAKFALMFQFEGDEAATRHVVYNVTPTRPSQGGQTTEANITPQTETINISAAPIVVGGKRLVKGSMAATAAGYANFFSAVVTPAAE